MNAPNRPDTFGRALALTDESRKSRTYRPIGHDAPKHSVEGTNYRAACIAAREVRGRAIHSLSHRASLEAWERGERAWPWPEPTLAEKQASDDAVRELIGSLRSRVEG